MGTELGIASVFCTIEYSMFCVISLTPYRMSMEMHAVHSNLDASKGDYVVVSYMYEAVKESNCILVFYLVYQYNLTSFLSKWCY
jgi:hypothetical protein